MAFYRQFYFVQLIDGKVTITNEHLANQIQTFIVTTVDGQVKLMTCITLLPSSSFVYYIYRNNFGIIYFDNYYFITNSVFYSDY